MTKLPTIAAMLGSMALAAAICTPAQAASFIAAEATAIACSADKDAGSKSTILPRPQSSSQS